MFNGRYCLENYNSCSKRHLFLNMTIVEIRPNILHYDHSSLNGVTLENIETYALFIRCFTPQPSTVSIRVLQYSLFLNPTIVKMNDNLGTSL